MTDPDRTYTIPSDGTGNTIQIITTPAVDGVPLGLLLVLTHRSEAFDTVTVTGTPSHRAFVPDSEARELDIDAETRELDVDAETREYDIDQESRTFTID